MKSQEREFPRLSAWLKRSSKQLHLTRDEIVRSTSMGSRYASAVWNGQNVRISYYLDVLRLLAARADHPRYRFTRRQLIESLVNLLLDILDDSFW